MFFIDAWKGRRQASKRPEAIRKRSLEMNEADQLENFMLGCAQYLIASPKKESARTVLEVWTFAFKYYLERYAIDIDHKLYAAPLHLLKTSFHDLGNGLAHPMFARPQSLTGRPPDGSEQMTFKAFCILISTELHRSASDKSARKRTWADIDAQIIAKAKATADLLEIQLSKESIKGWRRFAKDHPSSSLAKTAELYRLIANQYCRTELDRGEGALAMLNWLKSDFANLTE